MKSQKEKVLELLKSIETGVQEPAGYINPQKYIQHNLGVADGIAGFGDVLGQLSHFPEPAQVNTVRAFSDGDYVFTHTQYNFFGPKIGFDIFRFQDGKIVEHWDNLCITPDKPNPSNRTMIDGETEVKDHDRVAHNKELVNNFIKDIFINKNLENFNLYFNEDNLIQHKPHLADGATTFKDALDYCYTGGAMTLDYKICHKILGEGNFILAISEGVAGENGGDPTSFYDLFRIENHKITEYWCVVEQIIEESEWKNKNGKFGF